MRDKPLRYALFCLPHLEFPFAGPSLPEMSLLDSFTLVAQEVGQISIRLLDRNSYLLMTRCDHYR